MDAYEYNKFIGRGNYGSAHLVTSKETGEKLVVKQIPINEMPENERKQANQECALLKSLDHPNVVRYVDSFVEDEVLHIVMHYCECGDLASLIKRTAKEGGQFTEEQILDWFVQLASAVMYIHSKRILHRDLKTSNVFLSRQNMVKLGDFGIARVLDATLEQAKTVVGTPYYMSPEVCENKPYSFKSDLWALGCILYEMCTLKHAFDASNLLGLVFKIVQDKAPPIPDHYSDDLKDLVARLLAKDPHDRINITGIFALPFIKKVAEGLSTSGGTVGKHVPTARERRAKKKEREIAQRAKELEDARRKAASDRAVAAKYAARHNRPSVDSYVPLSTGDVSELSRTEDSERRMMASPGRFDGEGDAGSGGGRGDRDHGGHSRGDDRGGAAREDWEERPIGGGRSGSRGGDDRRDRDYGYDYEADPRAHRSGSRGSRGGGEEGEYYDRHPPSRERTRSAAARVGGYRDGSDDGVAGGGRHGSFGERDRERDPYRDPRERDYDGRDYDRGVGGAPYEGEPDTPSRGGGAYSSGRASGTPKYPATPTPDGAPSTPSWHNPADDRPIKSSGRYRWQDVDEPAGGGSRASGGGRARSAAAGSHRGGGGGGHRDEGGGRGAGAHAHAHSRSAASVTALRSSEGAVAERGMLSPAVSEGGRVHSYRPDLLGVDEPSKVEESAGAGRGRGRGGGYGHSDGRAGGAPVVARGFEDGADAVWSGSEYSDDFEDDEDDGYGEASRARDDADVVRMVEYLGQHIMGDGGEDLAAATAAENSLSMSYGPSDGPSLPSARTHVTARSSAESGSGAGSAGASSRAESATPSGRGASGDPRADSSSGGRGSGGFAADAHMDAGGSLHLGGDFPPQPRAEAFRKNTERLRAELVDQLGPDLFDRVYDFMQRKDKVEGNLQAHLLRIVGGDKRLMNLGFQVEMLLWQEGSRGM